MFFSNWFRGLRSRLAISSAQQARQRPRRKAWTRSGPCLESLEDRCLLSLAIREFTLPPNSQPNCITTAPDGSVWFLEQGRNMLGHFSSSGQFSEVPIPSEIPSGDFGEFLFRSDGNNSWNIWFGGNTDIGEMTLSGHLLHDFTVPSNSNFARIQIALGADGNIWYTEPYKNPVVGKLTPDGQATPYGLGFEANCIISGPDGNIWFGGNATETLGRITPGGTISTFQLPPAPNPSDAPRGLTVGPDGNLWMSVAAQTPGSVDQILRVNTAGQVTGDFSVPTLDSFAYTMTSNGQDNALWFVEYFANQIGRITPDGTITEYAIPTLNSGPDTITTDPNGNVWFTENNTNRIGEVVQNQPPVASAGGPYTIAEGGSLTLDASATYDPDGDALTYSWDINGAGTFTAATGVQPTLTWAQLQAVGVSDEGSFTVQVRVDDGHGNVVTSPATTLTVQPIVTWINPAGGDWDNPANWSSGQVPDADDDVIINALNPGSTVNHDFGTADAAHSLTSQAPIEVSAGSLSLASASTINNTLTLLGGTLTGSGNITVGDRFTWDGGTLKGTPGSILTDQGGMLLGNNSTLDTRSIVNPANQTFLLLSVLSLNHGARLENYGTIVTSSFGDVRVQGDALAALDNYGTFNSDNAASWSPNTQVSIPFNNYGLIEVSQGLLYLGLNGAPVTGYAGSSITGATGTLLVLAGPSTFDASSTLAVDHLQTDAPAAFAGSFTANSTEFGTNTTLTGPVHKLGILYIDSGTIDLSGATLDASARTLTSLTIISGVLKATGDLTVSGQFLTGACQIVAVGGPAQLTTAGGARIDNNTNLDGYTLLNPASQTFLLLSVLSLTHGARLENYGTIVTSSFGDVRVQGDALAALDNYGTFNSDNAASWSPNTQVSIPFNNYGVIDVSQGLLYLGRNSATVTGFAGSIIIGAPGTLLVLAGPSTFDANSSINLDQLHIDGSLDLPITGPNPGSGFASINVATSVSLGGQFHLDLANGFTPYLGEQFTIITNQGTNPVSGIFAGLPEGATITIPGYQLQISYVGGVAQRNVTLTVTQIPTTTTTVTSSVNSSVYGQAVTFTATVSTVTPGLTTPAGSVDFVDTTTNTDLGNAPLSGGSAAVTTSLLAAGSHDIEAIFAGAGLFGSSNGSVTQTVNKADLVVTANPNTKTYGQTASDSGSISGVVNNDGITASFSSPGDAASAPAGSYTITATLADPNNRLVNYNVHETNATLTVGTANLTVTPDPRSKSYGDPNPVLTGQLTGVTNGDNITASYSTSASQFSDVGSYAITATLNDPDNRLSNYTVIPNLGTLTIIKADQSITWSNPAPITYGTPLSGTQLNATVVGVPGGSPPGALAYSPAAGTVLNAGLHQALTATAAATTNYNAATRTVYLDVLPVYSITGTKFYDANGDGVNNDSAVVAGWTIYLDNDADFTDGYVASVTTDGNGHYTFTSAGTAGPGVAVVPALGSGTTWYVYEGAAPASGWVQTRGGGTAITGNPGAAAAPGAVTPGGYLVALPATLANTYAADSVFGNLKNIQGSGGNSLGFWTNTNGQTVILEGGSDPEMTMLANLNLVVASTQGKTGTGTDFNPASYAELQTWLKNARATDMAYMLSAQLAATALSVEEGFLKLATVLQDSNLLAYQAAINSLIHDHALAGVNGSFDGTQMTLAIQSSPSSPPTLLTYHAGVGLTNLGYISIGDLMLAANDALGLDYNTSASDTATYAGINIRVLQNALQTTLNALNNNQLLFVA